MFNAQTLSVSLAFSIAAYLQRDIHLKDNPLDRMNGSGGSDSTSAFECSQSGNSSARCTGSDLPSASESREFVAEHE